MEQKQLAATESLIEFISESPTAFHAVEAMVARLEKQGYSALNEGAAWQLQAGHGYYVTRNQSSIIAFRVPERAPSCLLIAASHTDSPTFKVKPNAESFSCEPYFRLNTEPYGGTILSSWLDRPLSLAGRVVLSQNNTEITAKNICFDRDLLLIPNVAIHMNRTANSGYTWNPAVDLLPLIGMQGKDVDEKISVKRLLSKELGCSTEEILGADLFVYLRERGRIWGVENEFFSAPRIDNLMCAYGTLQGFLDAESFADTVPVFYSADNEETGSMTKQGAGSGFLFDTLSRICEGLGVDLRMLLPSSMMVSADNAHAKHPNHPELSAPQNAPILNAGVVIKSNAAQKYATDAISAALFAQICEHADVPTQVYANRSDMAGGSTLGSISNTRVPLITVDIGMPQLAMHSCYETAGVADTDFLIRAMRAFYGCRLSAQADGAYRLNFDKMEGSTDHV